MLKNKMIISTVLLAVLSLGGAIPMYAAEGDTQTIEGINDQTSAEINTRGNLGAIDATDPETPLQEGDDRWIKVTVPTAVVFESKDSATITSPTNYTITNESGRPVKVDVATYVVESGNGVSALTVLNLKRTGGYQGNEIVNLVSGGAEVKTYTINTELVRLGNDKGVFGDLTNATAETTFEFTGTIDSTKLKASQNYVESKLTLKFTALRLDGKTTEEATA